MLYKGISISTIALVSRYSHFSDIDEMYNGNSQKRIHFLAIHLTSPVCWQVRELSNAAVITTLTDKTIGRVMAEFITEKLMLKLLKLIPKRPHRDVKFLNIVSFMALQQIVTCLGVHVLDRLHRRLWAGNAIRFRLISGFDGFHTPS